MTVDLETLNQRQLNELIEQARNRQTELAKQNISVVRDRIEVMLRDECLTIGDIYPGRGRRSGRKSVVAPKYRNPNDHEQTWSGRGKRPHWFKDALAAGRSDTDMLI